MISYHNHSTWSDGKAHLPSLVAKARSVGLSELGISDHLTIHPHGKAFPWAMPSEALEKYVGEVASISREQAPFPVKLGVEADFFPETVDRLGELLDGFPFDYVIGSLHFLGDFCVDAEAAQWEMLTEAQRNDVWKRYWLGIVRLADCGLFDIVGHLDLPKKFGFRPTIDLRKEIDAALDAIAREGLAIEINTSGWSYPANECYPSPEILSGAFSRGIPIQINADSHEPEHLIRDFDRAVALARKTGYESVLGFRHRGAYPVPL